MRGFTLWGQRLGAGNSTRISSIELRFGPNRSQKAHRFTVPAGATAGVPAANYSYRDYVDVPFEAWDITNNRQLMVSFRDQDADGAFNLIVRDDEREILGREYLYIHDISYSASGPAPAIAVNGGHEVNQMYNMWPTLTPGAQWNPRQLPESTWRVNYGIPVKRNITPVNVSDAYGQFDGRNRNIHVDFHSITAIPTNRANNTFRLILANDAGLVLSDDNGETFAKRGNGYNTTQFYSVDKKPGANEYIGGTQDNGSWRSPQGTSPEAGTSYQALSRGDGFAAIWNTRDSRMLITSSQHNRFYVSRDGGNTYQNAVSGMMDIVEDSLAPFITRLANSSANPDLLLTVGKSGVWRSEDFGSSWGVVRINSNWLYRASSASIPNPSSLNVEISRASPAVVWAGGGMSSFTRLQVSTDGGKTFRAVNNYQRTMGAISGLATHPGNSSTAYALFGIAGRPKILRTTDLGQTWEDLSGFGVNGTSSSNGFPDVAVNCLLVFRHDPNIIWAGTEIGIFRSSDGGKNWSYLKGLPAVSVWQMKLVDNQVVIATHGRGIWTADLPKSWQQPTGLFDRLPKAQALKIYPNPAVSRLALALPARPGVQFSVAIYNAVGQVVLTEQYRGGGIVEMNLEKLGKGAYTVQVTSGNERFIQKLLIDK